MLCRKFSFCMRVLSKLLGSHFVHMSLGKPFCFHFYTKRMKFLLEEIHPLYCTLTDYDCFLSLKVAKVIQKLANTSSVRESYMLPLEHFVKTHTEELKVSVYMYNMCVLEREKREREREGGREVGRERERGEGGREGEREGGGEGGRERGREMD